MKKILAGIEESETSTPDLDSDGSVTAKDLVVLMKMILSTD